MPSPGGMAYEAMNCAGYLKQRMIVILNDNGQVGLPKSCSFVYCSSNCKPANCFPHPNSTTLDDTFVTSAQNTLIMLKTICAIISMINVRITNTRAAVEAYNRQKRPIMRQKSPN